MPRYKKEFSVVKHRHLSLVWNAMLNRVHPSYEKAHRYFERGISLETMLWTYWPNFCRWALANGYSKGKILDRRDNDKGYSPENCRFVDALESSRNRDKPNLSAAITKGLTRYHTKPFVCEQTGRIFQTQNSACRELSISQGNLSRFLKGIGAHVGGFTFKYIQSPTKEGLA
jgi:hypothetical protein